MDFPNALRSCAYFTACSQAPRATPSICAPMPMRPSFRVSNLKLNALKIGDGLSERLALLRVFHGVLPGAARYAEHLRANADASFIQGFDGNLVAFAHLT